MPISRDQAQHLARLSKLTLTYEELDHLAPQLDEIIKAVGRIQEVATEGIPPTFPEVPIMHPFHDDLVRTQPEAEEFPARASTHRDGGFRLPSASDEG